MFITRETCTICEQGSLAIRVCGGDHHHLLIWCDECDVIWLHPSLEGDPYYPEISLPMCPHGDGILAGPESHWATEDEIRKHGWWEYVVGKKQSPEEWVQAKHIRNKKLPRHQ